MATSAREGGSGGRERDNRKGSNISSSHIIKKQPSPSSTTTTTTNNKNSSSLDQRKPFSTSTSRPAPNYLKPTISSRLDPSATKAIPRKPTAATSTATKPSDRRRSLDTQVKLPRSTISLSSSTPSKTTATTSTSSSSVKPRGPQRSMSSLSSRSAKQPAAAPSIRRSLSTTRVPPGASGMGLRRSGKKTGSKSVVSDSTSEMEARDKDPLDEMIGSQEDQDEVVSLPEISEMPGQEEPLGDPVIIEQPHLVLQDDHKVEEEQVGGGETVEDDQEVIIEASSSGENEENVVVEPKEAETEEGLTNVEEKHVVVELEESKEDEEEEKVDEKEVKDESLAKHEIITQSGNKKEVHDYNGVIEETASKLMEKRNKVRALAGAFETVISLQDPK